MATTTNTAADQMVGTVGDAMTQKVVTASEHETAAEVATRMAEENLRRIVVIDRERKPIGVVSQRDIVRHFLASEEQRPEAAGSVEIRALIRRARPVTVTPSTPLVKAALVLATNKIGCLPVVNEDERLVGVLTCTDLLAQITGYVGESLEAAFQFYTPSSGNQTRMPAYIRQKTGDLVIPLSHLKKADEPTDFVVLGYDRPSGRILVKFVDEYNAAAGVLRTKKDQETLVIPASSFVAHFELSGRTTPYDVTDHHSGRYLVLSPR